LRTPLPDLLAARVVLAGRIVAGQGRETQANDAHR
jgi:hypothetical protein